MIYDLKCDQCETGILYLDVSESIDVLSSDELVEYKHIKKYVSSEINRFYVYKCDECGATFRYNIKNILRQQFGNLMEMVLEKAAVNRMLAAQQGKEYKRILVYCGKCSGQDGRGSCMINVFNDCDLKELPIG